MEILIIIATFWALASSIATVTLIVRATEQGTSPRASPSTALASERPRPEPRG